MARPFHLWVIGGVALLWNAGGAFDYLMTQFGNENYLSFLTEEQRAYLDRFPSWATAAWAFGVWGAVAGSVLLLLQSKWAAPAFLLSILGIIGSVVWGEVLSDPPGRSLMGPGAFWFSIAVVCSIALLWVYARWMTARGHLR